MDNEAFDVLCKKIEQKIKAYHFIISDKEFIPAAEFGDFQILFSNGIYSFKLVNDTGKYFLHTKGRNADWHLITDFIDKHYPDSTLGLDMKAKNLYKSDFSLETTFNFIGKSLTLITSHYQLGFNPE